MKGYVFHYYKYGNMKDDDYSGWVNSKKTTQLDKDKPNEFEDYITFGEYDRVAIAQIDDFSRFRDLPHNAVQWRGKRRSILLYELDDVEYPLRILDRNEETNNFGFRFRDNNDINKHKRLFMGLTIITVSDEVRSSPNFETFLKTARIKILKKLDGYNVDDIDYEVFGTLGSTGIAIIWFTDQYSKILSMVEKINKFKAVWRDSSNADISKPCFTSLYTLLSKNRVYPHDEESEKINEITGKGMLFFVLKKQIGARSLKNILKKCFKVSELYHSMGEYDYYCIVEMRDIYSKFDISKTPSENAMRLNDKNGEFKENILRTKLVLQEVDDTQEKDAEAIEKMDETEENNTILLNDSYSEQPENEISSAKIYNVYQELRGRLKELFPHTAGMADSLDLLHSDYQSNYEEKQYIWSPDFSIQFYCVLKHLDCACKKVTDDAKSSSEDFLDKIRMLTNAFNQQIYHMFDSRNNLYLELPSCHLRYTGQQDMILYAYFGILKDILYYMKQEVDTQKRSYQPRLIPFVTIDVVPIIKTDFYSDISKYDEERPVILNLPSAALFDLPPHIAYIVHELFHYTAPKDRFRRNKLYLFVYFTEFMVEITYEAFMLLLKKYADKPDSLKYQKEEMLSVLAPVFRKSCFHYIAQKIDEICWELYNCGSKESAPEENYFFMLDNLMEVIISVLYLMVIAEDKECNQHTYLLGYLKSILSEFFDLSKWHYLEHILNEIELLNNDILDENFKNAVKMLKNKIKVKKDLSETNREESAENKLFFQAMKILYLEKRADAVYSDTINVFREVSADIAMVDLCGMDLVEYIFHYVRTKKNMLHYREDGVYQIKDVLRIGILLDWIMKKTNMGKDGGYRDRFVYRFITHYLIKDGYKKVEKLRSEAESWFKYIAESYKIYEQIYTAYRVRLFPDITNQYTVSEGLCQEFIEKYKFKKYRDITQECMDAVAAYLSNNCNISDLPALEKAKQVYDANMFELNVSLILQSQKQKYLSEITSSYKKKDDKENLNKGDFSELYKSEIGFVGNSQPRSVTRVKRVYNLEELLNTIVEYSQELKCIQKTHYGSQTPVVWYRGEESDKWMMLPKLLRMAQEKGDPRPLSILQRENMGLFKSICESMDLGVVSERTDSFSMLINMQHYGVGTNFLDWSEDAISALYFALRNTVDYNVDHLEGQEWWTRQVSRSTIYLFSPLLYNEALREFLQFYLREKKDNCTRSELIDNIVNAWKKGLPNISLKEYGDIFSSYIAGNIETEKKLAGEKACENCEWDKCDPFLPLAILPSRINPRVQAQSGNFMAFNLFAKGKANKDDVCCSYSYLDLKKIQEQFIEFFKKHNPDADIKKYIFLYQIVLANADTKEQAAEFVKATGMGTERVYPELQNIIEKKFGK